MTMKYFLLIVLILCILIGIASITLKDKVIVVQLVIPRELLPYYEWLISFPGLKPVSMPPAQEQFPTYKTYHL